MDLWRGAGCKASSLCGCLCLCLGLLVSVFDAILTQVIIFTLSQANIMISVFISSTSKDLHKHRQAVADACREAGLAPIVMDHFGARPEDAVTTCMNEVARADLFIGVYGWRYGFVPDGADRSITEMEYRRATELDKPRFCFLVREDYTDADLDTGRDSGLAARALEAFKKDIDAKLVRDTFTTPEDLKGKVARAISQWAIREKGFERSVEERVLREHSRLRAEIESCERDIRQWQAEIEHLVRQKPSSMGAILNQNTHVLLFGLVLAIFVIGMAFSESPVCGLFVFVGVGLVAYQIMNNRSAQTLRVDAQVVDRRQRVQDAQSRIRDTQNMLRRDS